MSDQIHNLVQRVSGQQCGAKNPVFKERYKGTTIYWHGIHTTTRKAMYGDETRVLWLGSIKDARAAVDADIAAAAAKRARNPAQAYWDSLDKDTRQKVRREFQNDGDENGPFWDQYESVADYAYVVKRD